MDSLIIEATEDSPNVNFDIRTNQYVISGKSRPENTSKFYNPIFSWLTDLESSLAAKEAVSLSFTFKMEYFNSISAKYIADIILFLKDLEDKGHNIKVKWHYQQSDEDMLEAGKEFANMVEMDFDLIAY